MRPAQDPQPLARILIVDDDPGLREQTAGYLAEHGYDVRVAGDAAGMQQVLDEEAVQLVLLDVMLPGEDGLSICRRLSDVGGPPVIMISALGEEIDRVLGLELGADDYMAKPCSPRELLARVRAVLRRREAGTVDAAAGRAYEFAGYRLDAVRRQLRGPTGVVVLLTAGEFSLLCAFLERPRRILSREELLEHARGGDAEVFDRAIDVQISRLRRKLVASSGEALIRTFRGAGYMLDERVVRA
ncbi:MAG TPA: response regulator [Caulobacteraceae bacterium]|jgi:two-component system OmpR family response regulator|nr:response regulator [Caulobacteraceae bacterium]